MSDGDHVAAAEARTSLPAMTRAASWMAAAQIATQVANIGSLALLASRLAPDAFGTVTGGVLITSTASLVVEAGTRGSLISTPRLAPGQLRRAVLLNGAIGVSITAALMVFARRIVTLFVHDGDASVLRALATTIALWSLSIVPLALLQKRLLFRQFALVQIASSIGATAAAIAAVLLDAGVWSLVLREVSRQAIVVALAWWYGRSLFHPTLEVGVDAPVRRQGGRWFLLLMVAQFVGLNVDYLIVGRLTDKDRLGLYAFAFNVAFLPLRQFSYQIGAILFAASSATRGRDKVQRQVVLALRVSLTLLLPLLLPAVALTPAVVHGLLKPKWAPVVVPLQILIVVGVGHALANIVGEFLSGTGHIAVRSKFTVLWAAAMLVVMPLMVRAHGIRGAALAHLMVAAPFFVLYLVGGLRLLGLDGGSRRHVSRGIALPLVAQVVAMAATLGLLRSLGMSTSAAGAGAALAGAAIFVGMSLATEAGPLRDVRAVIGAVRGR